MDVLFKKSTKHKLRSTTIFKFFIGAFFLFSINGYSQQKKDSTEVTKLDEVLISALKVSKKTPVSFTDLSKKEIEKRNLGQDIPILMNFLPSVVTTSDAGNGFGYTGLRVRGSDGSRVNVTVNGIPYNDSESGGSYFVDMPDFASSLQSIQLQRGVGTSTNGGSAFGASLNMLTDSYSLKSNGEISNSYGTFNSRKSTVKFSTGLMNNQSEINSVQGFEIAGRLSSLQSDGYIDRASSNLKSYFLQGTYIGKTTLIKALVFGGTEKTYQSWYGIDGETMAGDRTFNYAGMYTDDNGNIRFYDNQTDNYQQDHYQLHWNEKVSSNWNTNLAFHYTKGKGYYENFNADAKFIDFGLTSTGGLSTTNIIDQKWLDNIFYGTTFSANYKKDKINFIFGGALNRYEGKHFGKVIWAKMLSSGELGDHYYDDFATKNDATVYAKTDYQLNEKWSLYGDLQLRSVHYKANGITPNVNDNFNFFNPKAGITFIANKNNTVYFSVAKAQREPNRTDYEAGTVKPEKLLDYELGWRFNSDKVKWNTNLYYMTYKDQLILTGNLDNVGNPIHSNTEKSYRMGVEVDAAITVSKSFLIRPNITLSQNKNQSLKVDDTNYGDTDIAFSPSIIAGNIFTFKPLENFQISWLQKFVGKQFMNNIQSPDAKLNDYFVNDLNISYELKPKKVFKSVLFSYLTNNFLSKKYSSNGYMWDVYPYYYPQAGINFLMGMTLKF